MQKVAIVGAGLIGRAWANVFARANCDVALWDADTEALRSAPEKVAQSLTDLETSGLLQDAANASARVRVAGSLADAVAGAALVQENGPERLEVKTALFSEMDALADPDTILASSTSALVASRFTENLAGRGRCLVAHPVNPPHVVPVVELCGAPWTDPDTVARARTFYESVGQAVVEVRKEIDGFILNRMQAVLLTEAFRLIGQGYVTAADLDKTIKDGLGRRWAFMGPIETIELNAPGGIADYCDRYAETLSGLASTPAPDAAWRPENCQRVADSWGAPPSGQEVARKSIWRDQRLAALARHLKDAAPYDTD